MKARGDGTTHMLEFGGLVLIITIHQTMVLRLSSSRVRESEMSECVNLVMEISESTELNQGVMGDWAYYNFSVRISNSDQYVPAGSTEGAPDGKPLPPSLVAQPGNAKHSLQPVAYSEFISLLVVERRSTAQAILNRLCQVGLNELRLAKLAALACEAHMANKRWPFSMIGYRVSVYTAIICYI